jgi:hypothetical protein
MEGHHFGEVLAQEVFNVLEEYEISEKLFCITTDNAGNNTTLVRHLSVLLKDAKGIEWDPRKHHISCLNHIINLAVQDFLKSIKAIPTENDIDEDNEGLDLNDDDEELPPEGFMWAMFKIRTITKVHNSPICTQDLDYF